MSDYAHDPVFGNVAKAAASYLLGGPACANVLINGRRVPNAPRSSMITGLKQIFLEPISDPEKRNAGTELLDRIVADLQFEYGGFVRAFNAAKRELLDRRL